MVSLYYRTSFKMDILRGMKCSWPRTWVKLFRSYKPKLALQGGAKIRHEGGPFRQKTASSHWKSTATNRMHSIILKLVVLR